jgi:hypothetical protein
VETNNASWPVAPARSTLAEFLAWLWAPPRGRSRLRGLATVRLAVLPGRLVITPRLKHELLNYVLGIPPVIEYEWPAVVIDRLRPTGMAGVLVEVKGELGLVGVGFSSRDRLADVLRAAGFAVVERTRWGWEAPRRVAAAQLGEHVDHVPACIRAT